MSSYDVRGCPQLCFSEENAQDEIHDARLSYSANVMDARDPGGIMARAFKKVRRLSSLFFVGVIYQKSKDEVVEYSGFHESF